MYNEYKWADKTSKKGMVGGEQIRNWLFTGKEDNGNRFIVEHINSAKEDFN